MAKLSPISEYRKDGSKNIKAYRVSLQKTECEKYGFNENSEVRVEYSKNKIILIKEEN